MSDNEQEVRSALFMDRDIAVGNSEDTFLRRALHVKIANKSTEPVPTYLVDNAGATYIVEYGELNVDQDNETILVTYTVPASRKLITTLISMSGENIGEYIIYVNNIKKYTTRTNFGADLSRDVPISFELDEGDFITVKVVNPRVDTVTYNASINGELY